MSTNLIDQPRPRTLKPRGDSIASERLRPSSETKLLSSVTESNETRFITGFVLCMAIVCVSFLLLIYASILFAPEYVQIPTDAIGQ